MEYENYICKDRDGNVLVAVENMDEAQLSGDPLFTHCLAVVKVGNEYLLGRNKWRGEWTRREIRSFRKAPSSRR